MNDFLKNDLIQNTTNILYIALGIATALIPTIADLKKEAPTRTNPARKKFTTAGKCYLVIMMITLIIAFIKYDWDDSSQTALLVGNATLIQAHKTDSIAQLLRDQQCKLMQKEAKPTTNYL